MQSPSNDDAHDASFYMWLSSKNERTHQSLRTLLSEIEGGLGAGDRSDSLLQAQPGKLGASKSIIGLRSRTSLAASNEQRSISGSTI